MKRLGELQRGQAIVSDLHVMTEAHQNFSQKVRRVFVIIHDQDTLRCRASGRGWGR
jgi:hypothetical protein